MLAPTRHAVDKSVWSEAAARLLKRAASYPQVERIFVNPPIKAELCKWATGDRSWLAKVRPYYNHNYHFHIRMACPPGSPLCKPQAPVAAEGRHGLRQGTRLLDGQCAVEAHRAPAAGQEADEAGEAARALDSGIASC